MARDASSTHAGSLNISAASATMHTADNRQRSAHGSGFVTRVFNGSGVPVDLSGGADVEQDTDFDPHRQWLGGRADLCWCATPIGERVDDPEKCQYVGEE